MSEINKMFAEDSIKKINEINQEEQKKLKQKLLPIGFCIMILDSIELKQTKKGDPMFVITSKKKEDADEKFRKVAEYLVISENGMKNRDGINANLFSLLSFFINCFKFVVKDIDQDDPLGDLSLKLQKYKGKEYRGVIMHEESLNDKGTIKYTQAKLNLRHCGHINDTTKSAETVPKTVKRLSAKDQAILDRKILPDNVQKQTTDNHGTPDITDDGEDDLPF